MMRMKDWRKTILNVNAGKREFGRCGAIHLVFYCLNAYTDFIPLMPILRCFRNPYL